MISNLKDCNAAATELGYTWKKTFNAERTMFDDILPQGCAHHPDGNLYVYPAATGNVKEGVQENYVAERVYCYRSNIILMYCLFQIPAGENGHNFALKNGNFFFKISKLQRAITS